MSWKNKAIKHMSGNTVDTDWNNRTRHINVESTHFNSDPNYNKPQCHGSI